MWTGGEGAALQWQVKHRWLSHCPGPGWPRSKPPTLPRRVGIQNTLKSFLDVPQTGFGRCDLTVESGGEESENDGFSLVATAVEMRSSSTQIYPGLHRHLHLHAWWVNWWGSCSSTLPVVHLSPQIPPGWPAYGFRTGSPRGYIHHITFSG